MSLETEIVDMKSAAMLYNKMWCLILVFCFALFLPIQHLAKSFQRFPEFWTTHQEEGIKEFYVRKPVLEPRRETPELDTINDELECEAGCSFVNKGNLNTTIALPDIDI